MVDAVKSPVVGMEGPRKGEDVIITRLLGRIPLVRANVDEENVCLVKQREGKLVIFKIENMPLGEKAEDESQIDVYAAKRH